MNDLSVAGKLKENPICLWNDYVFKFIFADENSLCLKFLVESVEHDSHVKKMTIINPELKVSKVNGKKGVQDIRGKDDQGNYYGIEMQAGRIGIAFLNRLLVYHSQMISGQLRSGDDYLLLKQTVSIAFTTSAYDDELHIEYVLCDPHLNRVMENEKTKFHIISLPSVDRIVIQKQASREALTNLEMLAYVLRVGSIKKEMYEMANKEQRKVLAEMEERIRELEKDPTKVNDAIAAALIQATHEEDIAYYCQKAREKALLEGRDQGLAEGLEEGREDGILEMTIDLLMAILGEISEDVSAILRHSSIEQIKNLVRHTRDIKDEADVMLYLKQSIS